MVNVVIDPGHGGTGNVGGSSWNNATAPNDTLEKNLTLKVAKSAEVALRRYSIDAVLTRNTDVNLGIRARANVARDIRADAFVSIHFNAARRDRPPAQGTETWIESSATNKSKQLARKVQAAVQSVTGYRDRGVKQGNVSGVIRNRNHSSKTAHCLVEISFIDRQPEDEERLQNPTYISELGAAVANGIWSYLIQRGLIGNRPELHGLTGSVEPEDAATAAELGLIGENGHFFEDGASSVSSLNTYPEVLPGSNDATEINIRNTNTQQRFYMAQAIANFEAIRDSKGRLMVYALPSGDGGGDYQVAGISERYHKEICDRIVKLIYQGEHSRAENIAIEYIASFTDSVVSWCSVPAIECFLRDCIFNRGVGGAAWILQHSVGVTTDRVVGQQTRLAVIKAEKKPRRLLKKLKSSRETYERDVVGRNEQSPFWRGLMNRWKKAHNVARDFLKKSDGRLSRVISNSDVQFASARSDHIDSSVDIDVCCDMADKEFEEDSKKPGSTLSNVTKPDVITKYKTKHHYSRSGNRISHILIHYTTGDDYMGAVRTFEKPYWSESRQKWIRTSAHYIVGRKGELVQMVNDDRGAWHAGNGDMNRRSIGIEHAAAPGSKLTKAQNNKTIELIRWLISTYKIPRMNVIAHKCVRSTKCPGDILSEYGVSHNSGCESVNKAIQKWLVDNGIK